MLVRPKDIEVPEEDPFKNDVLSRKDLEPPLSEFVSQATSSFVLAIDGSWGSGKTTFIRMWRGALAQRGHCCLYFNAWSTDFVQDPLVALMGEISSSPALSSGKRDTKALEERLKKIASSILKRSIPALVRLATAGVLDLDKMYEAEVAKLAESIARDQIESYEKSRGEIDEFKNELEKLVQTLPPADDGRASKLVIFADELDRCRPTYAIEFLERIKHLFDVDGIVFVLGIDRAQLSHSIQAVYGSKFDARGYLRRFIDVDYTLPEPPPGDYARHLCEIFGVNKLYEERNASSEAQKLTSILEFLFSAAKLTLRTQAQTVSRLRIALQAIPRNHNDYSEHLAVFIFLREWKPDDYQEYFNGKADVDSIIRDFEGLMGTNDVNNEICRAVYLHEIFENVLLEGALEIGLSSERLKRYRSIRNNTENKTSEPDAETEKAKRVIGFIDQRGAMYREEQPAKITKERIDFATQLMPPSETD